MTSAPPPAAVRPRTAAPTGLRPLDLPLIGHSYPQLMRTPRARWWQPLASLGVVAGLLTALTVAALVPMTVIMLRSADWGAVLGGGAAGGVTVDESMLDAALVSAPFMLLNNLILVAFIGATLLAVAIAHPVAARFVHSVEGRIRWRWLGRAVLTLLPLYLVVVVGTWALDGAPTAPRAQDWVWLLFMGLLVTPFQAAGEEYLFRGWILLGIGSWIRRPGVAVAVAAAVSAAAFALAHGSLDPWILLDLAGFAVAAMVLTWRTGGLEAAIALHAVNNVVVICVGTLAGIGQESYIDAETTQTPGAALLSVGVTALATALLLWQARRAGVATTVPAGVGARP